MTGERYDVLVIGGGPAGAAAATVLAKKGQSVAVLERERFPRFHVGESLLPYQHDVIHRLGVHEKLESRGYVQKYGAHFVSNDGSCEGGLDFEEFLTEPYRRAWEVERADFDEVLLRHAEEAGAEVFEEARAREVQTSPGDCRIQATIEGRELELRSRFVLDASGQGTFLARRLGLRRTLPDLKKIALFTHYSGGRRRPGREAGNITLVFGQGCWFWMIPLRDDRLSLGCVLDQEHWRGRGDAEATLVERIKTSPYVSSWLEGARRERSVTVGSDFSYRSEKLQGPGWLMAGDAAAFLDPIFSTGVLLALLSGEAGAEAIVKHLGKGSTRPLEDYERRFDRWLSRYFKLIRTYYHPGFPAVFFNPKRSYQRAVAPFFGGHVDPGWRQRLYLAVFYRLVHWNHRFGFLADPRSEEARVAHV
ncbi:MAG: NAD(P)/FAD-dependent oxidoreductase [Planctomycetota bacterium]